jgi:hypothetical protein
VSKTSKGLKTPKGYMTTLDPPRLRNKPDMPEPELKKEPAKFIIGRVPMPEGRPRPRGKGD